MQLKVLLVALPQGFVLSLCVRLPRAGSRSTQQSLNTNNSIGL